MTDDPLGFESAEFGARDELSRERDRLVGAASAIDKRELSKREREDHALGRALAQLETTLTASRQLRRRRTLACQERTHHRGLQVELELPSRTRIGNLVQQP